jgi:multiple sugar transport system substrate-binding protein
MKFIKKTVAFLLLISMSFATISCNQSKPSDQNETGTEAGSKSSENVEGGGTFVFWDKSEYVKAYNEKMEQSVKKFGEEKNIDVEYIIVPPNDLKQKLMAGIEAKNVPDLVMGDDMLLAQFVSMDAIEKVEDITSSLELTASAQEMAKLSGTPYLVPLSFLAPGMYYRHDKFEAAGVKDYPTTWEELKEAAKKVNDPANGFYALGFPMGASGGGDAEGFMRAVTLAYGGIPVNEKGEVTINSPETLAAIEYVVSLFQEKLVAPDAITWDDSGNNNAYLAGTVGVICNSGSVWSSMKEENQDLLHNTTIIPYPSGPAGQFVPSGCNALGILKDGKGAENAKEFIKFYFADKDYYNEMIEAMGGMWQPVLEGMDDTEFWKKGENIGWLQNSKSIIRNFYPAPADERANLTFSDQLMVKCVQRILIDNMDPQDSLDQLEKDFKAVYEK